MCSPVELYFRFYLIFFLYEVEDVPRKMVFGVVPSKGDKRCPRKSGLSSLNLFPVKSIIGDPGKVVCLRCAGVSCACLSVVLFAFRSLLGLAKWLPCWEGAGHSVLRVCCRKNVLLCFMYFFPISMLGL